jgi:hypothetical protein
MDDIIIRYVDMPSAVRGSTVRDANGDYNVYLNSKLSQESQIRAYRHELYHIEENHFDRNEAFLVCEDAADFYSAK